MSSIVQLKRSALSGKVPGTGSLNLGELALNTYDGKIFFRRSGSTDTVQEVITTNVTNTGSITITGVLTAESIRTTLTASFGSLKVNDTLTINHGETIISGSALVTSDLTILGAVNARQFNISVISSSVLFESGSSRFGNTSDDIHSFTGSLQISGSQTITGSVTATSFVGNGSGLTNLVVDLGTAQLNDVDGNNIPARSFAELYLACADAEIVDLDCGI
jgi:cytoskeletal protein CcmA (bactofilin family)